MARDAGPGAGRAHGGGAGQGPDPRQPPGPGQALDGGRRRPPHRRAPPMVVPVEDLLPGASAEKLSRQMQALIRGYSRSLPPERRHLLAQFRLVHMARKVVGVGSVGTRAWILLMLGRDDADPLFLQAKEAQASVLEEYAGASEYAHHGERVVAGQRLMQTSGDIFLGTHRVRGIDGKDRDFYVRQLRDWKGSAVVEEMTARAMAAYASMCGWTPGARTRAVGGPHRDRRVPRVERPLRRGRRRLRRDLRGPQRGGLPMAAGRRPRGDCAGGGRMTTIEPAASEAGGGFRRAGRPDPARPSVPAPMYVPVPPSSVTSGLTGWLLLGLAGVAAVILGMAHASAWSRRPVAVMWRFCSRRWWRVAVAAVPRLLGATPCCWVLAGRPVRW